MADGDWVDVAAHRARQIRSDGFYRPDGRVLALESPSGCMEASISIGAMTCLYDYGMLEAFDIKKATSATVFAIFIRNGDALKILHGLHKHGLIDYKRLFSALKDVLTRKSVNGFQTVLSYSPLAMFFKGFSEGMEHDAPATPLMDFEIIRKVAIAPYRERFEQTAADVMAGYKQFIVALTGVADGQPHYERDFGTADKIEAIIEPAIHAPFLCSKPRGAFWDGFMSDVPVRELAKDATDVVSLRNRPEGVDGGPDSRAKEYLITQAIAWHSPASAETYSALHGKIKAVLTEVSETRDTRGIGEYRASNGNVAKVALIRPQKHSVKIHHTTRNEETITQASRLGYEAMESILAARKLKPLRRSIPGPSKQPVSRRTAPAFTKPVYA